MDACSPQSNLGGLQRILRLPAELQDGVFSLLANRDIKNLRVTCRTASDAIPLRFDRVFLSPHPRDIEVFNAVARHDKLRRGITEIIYDDAHFIGLRRPPEVGDMALDESGSPLPGNVPAWYKHSYDDKVQLMEGLRIYEPEAPGHLARAVILRDRLSIARSWEVYCNVCREQEHVMNTDADYDALLSGLSRFPKLKRVTLTPAAHGEDLRPLYETPMIRALPHGFIYPVPRGWPALDDGGPNAALIEPWETELVKNKWRGFRIVTRALASHISMHKPPEKNNIDELVIDSNLVDTGINCHVFTQENVEYDNIVAVLRQPDVKRFDLSLHVGGDHFFARTFFQSDSLRRAYAHAPGLEHVSLYTNIEPEDLGSDLEGNSLLEFWAPLQNFFPVDVWTNLRHFGLVNFLVKQSDLLALLKALPNTLESVELSFLCFVRVEGEGSYHELLTDIRNDKELGWRRRLPGKRPRIVIRVRTTEGRPRWFFTFVSREAEDYVYGNGENPFEPGSDMVYYDTGQRRDAFQPEATFPIEPIPLDWVPGQPGIV